MEKSIRKWKQAGIFDSFEEADSLRKELFNKDETDKIEVRVKRCGRDGVKFKVKIAYPPEPKKGKKPQ